MRCAPRHIESAYCLRHFTNDPRWREMGKTFLDSLRKYCRTDIGYAALSDVLCFLREENKAGRDGKFLFRGDSEVLILALRAAGDC